MLPVQYHTQFAFQQQPSLATFGTSPGFYPRELSKELLNFHKLNQLGSLPELNAQNLLMKSPELLPDTIKRMSLQDPLGNSPTLTGNAVFKSPIPQNVRLPIQMTYNMLQLTNQDSTNTPKPQAPDGVSKYSS